MNITRAKEYVLDTVRAYLATDEDGMPLIKPRLQRPLFLVGPPGIGKTAIMEQVASEMSIGLVAYSMTHHTRQSALGLPVINRYDYEGFEYEASEYTMSEIIASIYEYMRKTGVRQGILFLDEINCVSETLYPSMLQFLQFKTFGKHAVPQGWVIACAGNPPEYNRSVHEFDVVTLDRVRRLEVEPDVGAWKAYAVNAGVHPAVTTFLETEKDCFYRIESTPGGKRFVTARGWDDLSRMIAVSERLGMPVDQELVEQFVQDDEIAERFSMYYDLFRKYQSDYQVPSILAGEVDEGIVERARAAQIDERMALLGLMLDTLTPEAADLMLREDALLETRDVLRAAKPLMLDGGSAQDAVDPAIDQLNQEARRLVELGAGDSQEARKKKRTLDMLKACRNACTLAGLESGDEAFLAIHQEFRGFSGSYEADVAAYRARLENAFAFLEEAFGNDNEMLLFATDLTARRATAHFISRYGCEAFSRASQGLQVVDKHHDLIARIDAAQAKGTVSASAVSAEASDDELSRYYENAQWEYGYASLCHMALPSGLEGKTVVDVGCRRGKGVFKLSDRVGAKGLAIGIDWVSDHIAEATARMDRAARETGLPSNNMEFHKAYPEDLLAAGLGDNTVDMAFVNSVLHLTCRPDQVLSELHRVLKPGGLLVCEVALATGERDEAVVQAARALGNSIQAAPCRDAFERRLSDMGFDFELVEQPHPVQANMGFKRGHEAPTVETSEAVGFEAMVFHATKR